MTGFNLPEDKPEVLGKELAKAVSLVSTAMREGMLEPSQIALLEAGGVFQGKTDKSSADILDDLLSMADVIKMRLVDDKGGLRVTDPGEIGKLVNVVVKLIEQVTKRQSEARKIEELKAVENCLHQLIDTMVQEAKETPAEAVVSSSLLKFQEQLETELGSIQRKYEER